MRIVSQFLAQPSPPTPQRCRPVNWRLAVPYTIHQGASDLEREVLGIGKDPFTFDSEIRIPRIAPMHSILSRQLARPGEPETSLPAPTSAAGRTTPAMRLVPALHPVGSASPGNIRAWVGVAGG